jgi:hypothetical protein
MVTGVFLTYCLEKNYIQAIFDMVWLAYKQDGTKRQWIYIYGIGVISDEQC